LNLNPVFSIYTKYFIVPQCNKDSHLFPIGYANVAFTPKVLISICLLPIKILPLPVKVQQNLIISF
ncbi:hypothetical protein, partial [Bacteroides cellulosilyticus]|uniref:hypothetical protein n=1 Tax=Bacteroides cellulosilyticus TaxID=246787 RepID=UPI001C7063FD